MTDTRIKFRIILEKTPLDVCFGLQKGKGTPYETIQKQLGDEKNLSFEGEMRVKKTATGSYDFFGDCIQGTTTERFIYIGIGMAAGQLNSIWSRRLKVPLRGITAEMILKLNESDSFCLETKVPAIGKDSTPNCATVKPFDGWLIQKY
jgi:Family of unknown function (DUF5990)